MSGGASLQFPLVSEPIAGHISAPVPLSFLKWRLPISPVSVMESWVAKTEECRRSRDRRRAFLFGLIHHLSNLRHRSHCLSFFFFHFQVTYVALGLLNHNRDLVGNSVLDCLRGKASLFLLTQFKLNNVYHLVMPS